MYRAFTLLTKLALALLSMLLCLAGPETLIAGITAGNLANSIDDEE
jgi:hypothetical protein